MAEDKKPGIEFNVVKKVNLPTLSQADNTTVYVRIDQQIRQEVNIKEEDAIVNGAKVKVEKETIINVVRVTNLEDSEEYEYVCNAMTADNIRGAYPEHSYVGKTFAITKKGLAKGKQYKETDVVEIEVKS